MCREARKQAALLPPDPVRDALLEKARQYELAQRLICLTMPKNRLWDPAEDDTVQRLSQGRYAVDIVVGMSRSEATVWLRAKVLALSLATAPRGPRPR
jgi:hypothetical protein